MDVHALKRLIEEFRSAAESGVLIRGETDGGFTLSLDDTDVLTTEWAEDPPRLVTTIELGQVSPSRKVLVYEAMLTYNLLWREARGARMALGGPDGAVTLVHEWHASQPSARDLSALLAQLCRTGSAWRRFVVEASPDNAAQAPRCPPHLRA